MSDGGRDMNEERRKNRGDEESPLFNIGMHDKLHAEIPVLFFLNPSHLLPHLEETTCDKLSITATLYISLYIGRDATFIFLLPFLANNFHFSHFYTIYALPPQYTLYSHISSPNIGTLSPLLPNPLQKRHHSPHNPQQPGAHLHTPRSVLARRTRRVARPRAGGTRRSTARRACACLRPTRTSRRHRALSPRNYCDRTRRSDGGTGA